VTDDDREQIELDLSTPGGRAKADQYLADVNRILDDVVTRTTMHLGVKYAHGVDRTAAAVALIASSQDNPRDDVAQLFALAVHRLATLQLESPATGVFNARLLPSSETEIMLKLPAGAIARGDPPWKHLRIMAAEIMRAADEQERNARP
jgi:hypothetical protein